MRKLKRFILSLLVIGLAGVLLDSFYLSLRRLNLTQVELVSPSIPESFNDSKILVFSDIYSDTTNLSKLKTYAATHNPDLIIFMGNLLDKESLSSPELERTLRALKAPLGKYAILSENDYALNEATRKVLNDTGFRVVDTDLIPIHRYSEAFINIALISSIDVNNAKESLKNDLESDHFTLGFTHNPNIIEDYNSPNINAWFAGKTNLGKVNLPFIGSLIYNDEPHKKVQLIQDVPTYLSGGVGTNSPRLRLGANPDIILITLKSSQ